MPVAMLFRPELREYDFGPGHPFRGDRFDTITGFLKEKLPPEGRYEVLAAPPATEEDLRLICDEDYIDFTRRYFEAAHQGLNDNGQFSRYHSPDNHPAGRPGKVETAARYIVGQARLAADLVLSGRQTKAISLGGGLHHAKRRYGEGFCLYNDVAFAGTYLLEKLGLKRLLILDTDAHAGNGTSEYFYAEPRVLFIDLHQDPMTLYPGTGFVDEVGSGAGEGFNINIPMPPGAGDESYRLAFEEVVEPLCAEFRPELIIRNGGSDPHFSDGLTRLGVTVSGFHMIGERVRRMTGVCGGRQIDLIASGYNEKVLPYAWLALISGITGFEAAIEEPGPAPASLRNDAALEETRRVIQRLKGAAGRYWRSL